MTRRSKGHGHRKSEQLAFLLTTTQRDALLNPQEGTIIFNTTTKVLNVFENSVWVAV